MMVMFDYGGLFGREDGLKNDDDVVNDGDDKRRVIYINQILNKTYLIGAKIHVCPSGEGHMSNLTNFFNESWLKGHGV